MLPSVVLYANRKSAWVGILYEGGLESNSEFRIFTFIPASRFFPRHAWNTKLIDIWLQKEVGLYLRYHDDTAMFEIHTVFNLICFKYGFYFGHCLSSWVSLPTFCKVYLFLSLLVSWTHYKHLVQCPGLSLYDSSSWVWMFLCCCWWQKCLFSKCVWFGKTPVIVQCQK